MDKLTTLEVVNLTAEPLALTIRGAVAYSGFSRTRIFELLKSGVLESRLDGAKRLILTTSLKAAVLALPTKSPDKAA